MGKLKQLWGSIPHQVQAALVGIVMAIIGSIGDAWKAHGCLTLACLKSYVISALFSGVSSIYVFYMKPNQGGPPQNSAPGSGSGPVAAGPRSAAIMILALSLGIVAFNSSSCAYYHAKTTPPTAYEKAVLTNGTLATVNNSIAHGLMQLDQMQPPLLSKQTTAGVLRLQAQIATDDNRIAAVLDSGQTSAGGSAAQIGQLLDDIKAQVNLAVQDQSLGIKNPASQQTFLADFNAIYSLADQVVNTLHSAGVLK